MPGKRKGRVLLGAALASGLLVLAAGAAVAGLALSSRPAEGIPTGGALFAVKRGEGASAVARGLESEGLLRSGAAFKLLARLRGLDDSIKAGTYRLMPGMGASEILELLASGKQALVRVTLPEGYTLGQAGRLLEDFGIAKAADFAAACRDPALLAELGVAAPSLEGYLFPDTYLFPVAYGAREAASAMVANFREKLASIPEAASLSPKELQERLVLASIVEREYRLPEEAPLMAGVFLNRLRIGMALQSCATVVYVMTERLGKPHPERLFDRDIAIEDPYNSYIHRGLPPGPISNPGMTALLAALRPASSKYLYFRLVDEATGKHHFSATLEEHVGARSLFVKRVGG